MNGTRALRSWKKKLKCFERAGCQFQQKIHRRSHKTRCPLKLIRKMLFRFAQYTICLSSDPYMYAHSDSVIWLNGSWTIHRGAHQFSTLTINAMTKKNNNKVHCYGPFGGSWIGGKVGNWKGRSMGATIEFDDSPLEAQITLNCESLNPYCLVLSRFVKHHHCAYPWCWKPPCTSALQTQEYRTNRSWSEFRSVD